MGDERPLSDSLGRAIERAAYVLAAIGGVLLIGLSGLIVLNIALRAGWGLQLRGEFDLASLGAAVAVFCFLPYGQVTRAHMAIDFLTRGASARSKRALDAFAACAFAAALALLAWRMALGGVELAQAGQVTAVLRIPYWAAYLAAAPAMALTVVASVHDAHALTKAART